VSVLLGTALLALVGFGLGIGAGLVLEQPGLLIDYLVGRTTPAPLDAARAERDVAAFGTPEVEQPAAPPPPQAPAETAAPTPDPVAAAPAPVADSAPDDADPPAVAAAPPPRVEARPAPPKASVARAPAAVEETPEQKAVSALPPGKGGFSVQVGALADSAGADALAARLRKRGFPVYVAPSAEPGSQRWRVRVGPVATREEARALAERLEREKLPTWVLAEGLR
jgi:DedD protein